MTRSAVNGGKHGVMALINIQRVLAAVWVATLSSRKATVAASMNSRLIVHMPQALNELGGSTGFRHQHALFGQPSLFVGRSLVQPLYYVNSTLCPRSLINNNNDKTESFYPSSPFPQENENQRQHSSSPFVLLIHRSSSCTFVQQVRNAQHMGAAGVLIADDRCVCTDQECRSIQDAERAAAPCQSRAPVMADDGSGNDISIPSFLMYKQDADLFRRTLLETNQNLQIEMSFFSVDATTNHSSTLEEIEHQVDEGNQPKYPVVTLDFWMSPTDWMSTEMVTKFQPAALAFSNRLQFNMHMFLVDGVKLNCRAPSSSDGGKQRESALFMSQEQSDYCSTQCTNHGRYCSIHVSNNDFASLQNLPGSAIVTEALRQLCIWFEPDTKSVETLRPKHTLWWAYVKEFHKSCFSTNAFDDQGCTDQVYKKVGISHASVDSCISNSGGLGSPRKDGRGGGGDVNSILEKELDMIRDHSIYALPTLYMDGVPHNSAMTASTLFSVVCSQFHFALPRDALERMLCDRCDSSVCTDFSTCIQQNGICPDGHAGLSQVGGSRSANIGETSGRISLSTFWLSIAFILSLATALSLLHYRRMRTELKREMTSLVAEYILVADSSLVRDTEKTRSSMESNHSNSVPQSIELSQEDCFLQNPRDAMGGLPNGGPLGTFHQEDV